RQTHDVVAKALTALRNLEHRGAEGGDPDTGDGAGILTQLPDEFLRAVAGFPLPEPGAYAVGMAFLSSELPVVAPAIEGQARAIEGLARDEGLTVLGWREVPFDGSACGAGDRAGQT